MATEPGFARVKPQLTEWWNKCKITRQKDEIDRAAKRLYARKAKYYDPIEKQIGVPWYMVAVIDERESGARGGVLHNGDMIVGTGRKTIHVPKGRGPFNTWHDAAIDALTMPGKRFNKVDRSKWSIELVLYCLEAYNGWGYRQFHPKTPSPYVWSCTNIYDNSPRGKYVSDGVWGEGVTDKQIGCAPLLKSLLNLNKSNTPVPAAITAGATTIAGGTVLASTAPHSWWPWILGGSAVIAFVIGIWTWIVKRSKKDDTVTVTSIPNT
jgi:lysozyme family protein